MTSVQKSTGIGIDAVRIMLSPTMAPTFEQICHNYNVALRKRIHEVINNLTVEDDIYQDVMLKMFRFWRTYDPEKGSIYAWIMSVTTSTCIDYHRKMRSRPRFYERASTLAKIDAMNSDADPALERSQLLHLAERLSMDQCKVVKLIYFKGHTQSEAAILLNWPLGTVKSRQRAALVALRKMCNIRQEP